MTLTGSRVWRLLYYSGTVKLLLSPGKAGGYLLGLSSQRHPPKYAVSQVVGFIKGKSAIHLARVYGEQKRNFVGQHFWARGYFVSTVGRDEEVIREYIRNQENEDTRLEQLSMWK